MELAIVHGQGPEALSRSKGGPPLILPPGR